jgi:hypothetical protein
MAEIIFGGGTTMAFDRLISINLTMTNCRLDGAEPARQMLDILAEAGCKYYYGRSPDPHPERSIREGSIISGVSFTHPLLKPSLGSRAARLKEGGGDLCYIAAQKKVLVFQSPYRDKDLDDLAAGLLEFAKQQYLRLRPTYAYLDETGENAPQTGVASAKGIKCLFWANIFSGKLVKQIGEKFLLKCPARVELLDDGGILLASRDRFTKWLQRPEHASADYLARKLPKIRRFSSTGVED